MTLGSTPTSVRRATAADRAAVEALLNASDLPLAGVPEDLAHFLVAEADGQVVGAIGLEVFGAASLLRSAVVHPARRGTHTGEALVNALLAHARAIGITDVALLTTTAARWFPRFGFVRVERTALPATVFASAEFQGACPVTAVAMHLRLGRG